MVRNEGLSYVIAGVNKEGVVKFEDSVAAELREMEKGFEGEIPDDCGGTRKVWIRAFFVNFAADWLAASGAWTERRVHPSQLCPAHSAGGLPSLWTRAKQVGSANWILERACCARMRSRGPP